MQFAKISEINIFSIDSVDNLNAVNNMFVESEDTVFIDDLNTVD